MLSNKIARHGYEIRPTLSMEKKRIANEMMIMVAVLHTNEHNTASNSILATKHL